jgi:DNA-binding MurR/RpiR family transcriptional regulator
MDAPIEAFLDIESLHELENPVNLHLHHHEELISRSLEELEEYAAIMQAPIEERVPSLRAWYARCTERAERVCAEPIRELDFEKLCATIQRAKNVQFFGGSSCRILRQLDERGLSGKIECNIQMVCAGSTPSMTQIS